VLIPARFDSLAHAYEVSLELLTASLEEAQGHGDGSTSKALARHQRQLAQLCSALLAKDWRKVPVVPEALIAWRREERELQLELRGAATVPAVAARSADDLIEQVSSKKAPLRFRKARALRAPRLGAQRSLLSLLRAMPVATIQKACEALFGGQSLDKKSAVVALRGAFQRGSGLRSAMAYLGEVERLILGALLRVGGELPLAELPAGMGSPLQHVAGSEFSPLAVLEALGLVHLGTDPVQDAVLVVVPAEIRDWLREPPAPVAHPEVLQLHVQLVDIEPPVWRRFLLRGDATLEDLHDAIQTAFDWMECHLHEFRNAVYGPEVLGGMARMNDGFGPPTPDEATVHIAEVLPAVGDTLAYWYDFGDSWWHLVRREAPSTEGFQGQRLLLGGERAGPLEDSGGPPGYAYCAAVALGEAEDEDQQEWIGDWHPEAFDLQAEQEAFWR
jgi:hypothetical protein